MSRWALGIALALLVVTAGLAWRGNDLSRQLTEARGDLGAAVARVETLERTSGDQAQGLEDASEEVQGLRKKLRSLRQALGDSQRCPGYPRLILSPSSGPPGTRVNFVGYCFVGDYWGAVAKGEADPLTGGYGLFVINPAQDLSDPTYKSNGGPDCELIAGTEPNELVVRPNGTASGHLTIPTSGGCFQQDREEAVSPGEYHIGLGCHACSPLAIFRVTD